MEYVIATAFTKLLVCRPIAEPRLGIKQSVTPAINEEDLTRVS